MKTKNYGELVIDGCIVTITREPYLDDQILNGTTLTGFFSSGEDEDGFKYDIFWPVSRHRLNSGLELDELVKDWKNEYRIWSKCE